MSHANDDWPPAFSVGDLDSSTVHIWRADLDLSPADGQHCRQLLTADEIERADRFRFPHLRDHYTAARGILRILLSSYLGVTPQQVAISCTKWGKPYVDSSTSLHFNLSHSNGWALYAFSRDREVGIDLEKINPAIDVHEIAAHFFSLSERRALQTLPAADQHSAFFACWTRKEAYIKAHGEGLSLPLSSFDVSIPPDDPPRLIANRLDPTQITRWHMEALHPQPGFMAAVVVEGRPLPLICRHYALPLP